MISLETLECVLLIALVWDTEEAGVILEESATAVAFDLRKYDDT